MACCKDLVRLLENYEQGLGEVLNGGQETIDEQLAEKAREFAVTEEASVQRQCEEDAGRIDEAQQRYLGALAVEQDNWFKKESEAQDAQQKARHFELDVVGKHLEHHGRSNLQEALNERCEHHVALLSPGSEAAGESRLQQAEKAKQEWTTEVCKAVIMEMRKEWRTGQRKVLQQLAGELRAERKAAADALERQITMSKKVSETVKGMWSNEIQSAQDELDEVAEAYKKALKFALEAKLREARQHAKEQAEFFQKEIREALLFEQQEHSNHCAQLRRMRLAMLKWRFDYMADAKRKAAEFVCRGVLAKLAGLGVGPQKKKKKKGGDAPDPDMAQGEGGGGDKKDGAKDGEDDEPKTLGKKQKGVEPGVVSPSKEDWPPAPDSAPGSPAPASKVRYVDGHSESTSSLESSTSGEEGTSEEEINEVDQALMDCRLVLEKLWSRIQAPDSLGFLFKLEDLIPYEEEILLLYEDECMKHGVMCTLDATDGRAEEALQAEKEADLASKRNTQEEKIVEKPKKKKNAKPAIPTVKRRVQLLP